MPRTPDHESTDSNGSSYRWDPAGPWVTGRFRSQDFFQKQWLDSNFIPMDSKKFGFRKLDYIIRFAIKNESEIEKLRSRDRQIF